MQTCCLHHGQRLRAEAGENSPAYLRFLHGLAAAHTAYGSVDAAVALLREMFDRREKAFGETHEETLIFIDDLLRTYCEEGAAKPRTDHASRNTRAEVLDCLLLDELIELCLGSEAFEEVDDLVSEGRFTSCMKATTRASPDGDFEHWSQFELKGGCRIQPRLASFKAPGESFYWEDSRRYMRAWGSVQMVTASPEVPGGGLPARIQVTETGMDVKLPNDDGMDGRYMYKDIRTSEIWRLLDTKRVAKDWNILLAWDGQRNNQKTRRVVEGLAKHEFFVFGDAVVPIGEEENPVRPIHTCSVIFGRSAMLTYVTMPTAASVENVQVQETRYTRLQVARYHSKREPLGFFRPTEKNDVVQDDNEPIPGDGSKEYRTFQFDFLAFQPRGQQRGPPTHQPLFDDLSNSGAEYLKPRAQNSVTIRRGKFRELDYQITDAADPKYVDLVVPYMDYSHFQTTSVYKTGIGYKAFLNLLRCYSVGDYGYDDVLVGEAADMCVKIAAFDALQSGGVSFDVEQLDDENIWLDWLANCSEKLCNGMELAEAKFPVWLPKGVLLEVLYDPFSRKEKKKSQQH